MISRLDRSVYLARKCPICGKIFYGKDLLKEHKNKEHSY